MINSSYDTSKPIITPSDFFKKSNIVCDTCIVTFSNKILDYVVKTFNCKTVGPLPIYTFEYNGKMIATYLSKMGAAQASMDLLAANQIVGATRFIVFGSAGSLDSSLTSGKFIIPTQAYRDEGLSYHYAPAADFIDIPTSEETASFFSAQDLPFISGKVWTTDALFMETQNKVETRKSDGCLAVDMELSGLQAVCNHYGLKLYYFLQTGDVLGKNSYSKDGLSAAHHNLNNFDLALNLATFLKK